MTQTTVAAIESTVTKTHTWLQELAEIGRFTDESQAYSALRAALHAIRDRLTVDEAVHLAAQFPMLVRGIYFEGWKPSATPVKGRSAQEFYKSVADTLRNNVTIGPDRAVSATFQLLDRKISAGEMDDVKRMMPAEIRELWPTEPRP